jgi:CheY-like chemotaxis protein
MPDLILMDFAHAVCRWVPAIEILKSDEKNTHIPIMASPTTTGHRLERKVTELGCVRCVDKTRVHAPDRDIVDEFLPEQA